MKTVTMLLDEYLVMMGLLSTLNDFLIDFKVKLNKIEGNESFKDALGTWISLLEAEKEVSANAEKENK